MNLEIVNQKNLGSQKETLLFIHGICHGAWTWKNFMQYFSVRGYDCYSLSLRGHCGSEGRENLDSFTMDDYVQDVIQAASQFNGDVIVIGHSMGGGVVQKLIGEHPGHVKGAILFASIPPCGIDDQGYKDMVERAPKGAFDLIKLVNGEPLSVEEIYESPLFGGRIPMEDVKEYYTYFQNESKKAVEQFYTTIAQSYDVEIPVGVIGSSNDLIFAEREQRLIAEAYGVEAVILKDLCHDMMLDPEWEKSAEALLNLLEKLASN